MFILKTIRNNIIYRGVFMDEYIYIMLKINRNTGEVENMSKEVTSDNRLMKEILDVYKKLNIDYKKENQNNEFEKYTKYNYNERSSMTTTTYAKI